MRTLAAGSLVKAKGRVFNIKEKVGPGLYQGNDTQKPGPAEHILEKDIEEVLLRKR